MNTAANKTLVTSNKAINKTLSGGQIVVEALKEQNVDTVFGYPGGAALPIYDAIFQQNHIRHILVRHEQGAVHAAEGYARSTGKPGVVLVTSGPGATNAVTGITDALLDSVPIIVISGQVPTFLIGNDAFQEADVVGITRPCTKMNWLIKDVNTLAETIHMGFHIATNGRPGPVLIDIPKDIQFASAPYVSKAKLDFSRYTPEKKGHGQRIQALVEALESAKKPIFYTGGGVINSGRQASTILQQLVNETHIPITSTLLGLGAYPAKGDCWLGMHGLYEANMAMHGCDLMINVGARFDDRITGRVDQFSPKSFKAHIDIDASSINKIIKVDVPIIGDAAIVLQQIYDLWVSRGRKLNYEAIDSWWKTIESWRKVDCLKYKNSKKTIKPQYALERLEALTADHDRYVTTEVGQHQMWAAQFMHFNQPQRWMTSGGLGTMGYGLPASIGVQLAYPDALVINVAGEASWLMNMQEIGTAVQFNAPVKQFILNNERLGMVRQWQELLHGERYSHSWSEALPNFVKLAEAFGVKGICCDDVADLDDAIMEMIETPGPVIFDCLVEKHENCFPMIPSGAAHNNMLLGENSTQGKIDDSGAVLV